MGVEVDRRQFLILAGTALAASAGRRAAAAVAQADPGRARTVRLFFCGDVMTGRGIDQVLAHPSPPRLYEPYVRHAGRYVALAEERHGPIPRPVDAAYPWGEALAELEAQRPDLRIVNLETAVTRSNDAWPGKGIHYRMHPANIGCLTAAKIDCCVLANNHVLDWGYDGLAETLAALREAGIATAGAGGDAAEAEAPAVLQVPDRGRVILFALASTSSGVPPDWEATAARPGVNLLADRPDAAVERLRAWTTSRKSSEDLVVASIHWGSNWGYGVPRWQRQLARRLVEEAGVDVVHGHSSHHPKGIEVVAGRPVLYGCGDFLNDYEGIGGHEAFRGDLAVAYFLTARPATGRLTSLTLLAFQSRRFRLRRASAVDVDWLRATLDRECRALGAGVVRGRGGALELAWGERAQRDSVG